MKKPGIIKKLEKKTKKMEPQSTHRGLRPQPKNWNRRFHRFHRLKIITIILGYMECSLKKVFKDASKKFLHKKQEIERYVVQIIFVFFVYFVCFVDYFH